MDHSLLAGTGLTKSREAGQDGEQAEAGGRPAEPEGEGGADVRGPVPRRRPLHQQPPFLGGPLSAEGGVLFVIYLFW